MAPVTTVITLCILQLVFAAAWQQAKWTVGMPVSDILKSFPKASWSSASKNNVQIVKDPFGSGDAALQVKYPKGSRNPSSPVVKGGAGFGASFPPAAEAIFSYEIAFQNGFDFVKGGKLPGMFGGGGGCSGGADATAKDCFSTRYMWGQSGVGYVYYYGHKDIICGGLIQCSKSIYGHSIGKGVNGFTFIPGRWYEIKQRVRLNTGTKNDGVLTVWLNGKQLFSLNNMKYFGNSAGNSIDGFYFSTFFGGNTEPWNSSKDQYSYFRNFKYQVVQTATPTFG